MMPETAYPKQVAEPLSDLREQGYCVLKNVLTANETAAIADRIELLAAHERETEKAWYSHANQRIFMLLNKGEIFYDLIDHRATFGIVKSILGDSFLLSSITANIANPDNTRQPLHSDQDYMAAPRMHSEVMNVAFLIDDFEADNGATVVVPRSHFSGIPPTDDGVDTIPIEAKSGSVIFLDGRVWHGTGQNITAAKTRRAIFCYYCKPYIRQQENFARSLLPHLRKQLTPIQRQLLGFDMWMGLGAVNGPPPAWADGREKTGPSSQEKNLTPPPF